MMTLFAAKIAWFLGIVGWFVIRYPFQRRARQLGVARSAVGTRERVLLTISATGQFIIPLIYVVTGQPAVADTAFYPWIAALGVIVLIAALILFRVGKEEALMVETFGEQYRIYMRKTARIVPFIY